MKSRLTRTLVVFLAVGIAYAGYAGTVARWMEPQHTLGDGGASGASVSPKATARYQSRLEKLFPPGSWELDGAKVLESEQLMLLLKDYRALPDGRLEIKPCTVVIHPKKNDASNASGRTIIMRAPEGALLEFESPLDLQRGQLSKLAGGRLVGRITIQAEESAPGADDRLDIVTRNVQILPDQIWTPHEVRFRLGRSHGSGRDLIIRLFQNSDSDFDRQRGYAMGVKSLELVHLDKLHVELPSGGVFGGGEKPLPVPQANDVAQQPEKTPPAPVEITCQGPFQFDLVECVATFEDEVEVARIHAQAESDQLHCQMLALHFAPGDENAPGEIGEDSAARHITRKPSLAQDDNGAAKPFQPSKLDIVRIVALGDPVTVRSPSYGANVQGERLEYDFIKKRISVEATDRVMLRHGQHEVEARAVQYEMAENGGLGRLWAAGPGWYRGQGNPQAMHAPPGSPQGVPESDDKPMPFEARWGDQLLLRPHRELHVLSLTQNASLGSPNFGSLAGDEIHVWLVSGERGLESIEFEETNARSRLSADSATVQPQADALHSRVRIDRLLARGNVRLDTPRLTGRTERLELWIRELPANANSSPSPAENLAGNPSDSAETQANESEKQLGQIALSGRVVQVQIVRQGETTTLAECVIDGAAQLTEAATSDPRVVPLVLRGERLQVRDAETHKGRIEVFGQPAVVSARGMSMTGEAIRLDRGLNRLWIDGAGQIAMPLDRGLDGEALSQPQRVNIVWQGRLLFDGRTFRCEKEVTITAPRQHAAADAVEATLARQIDFGQPPQGQGVEVHSVRLDGNVRIENRGVDEWGKPTSIDRLSVAWLTINQYTGDMLAAGPGYASSVRLGSPMNAAGPNGFPGANGFAQPQPGPSLTPAEPGLVFVGMHFQREMRGNYHRRELECGDRVKAIYGPVESWSQTLEVDDPTGPGEHNVLLSCDKLTVAEMGPRVGNRGSLELQALGNAVVEGMSFTARADRLAYAEAKDLIVLEGGGRTDAELWRQTYPGGPQNRAAARKILFWRSENRVEVDDARHLDLSNLGPLDRE